MGSCLCGNDGKGGMVVVQRALSRGRVKGEGCVRIGGVMFEALTDKLTGVLDRLTSRGRLSEKDVDDALRQVRLALLGADVNFQGGEGVCGAGAGAIGGAGGVGIDNAGAAGGENRPRGIDGGVERGRPQADGFRPVADEGDAGGVAGVGEDDNGGEVGGASASAGTEFAAGGGGPAKGGGGAAVGVAGEADGDSSLQRQVGDGCGGGRVGGG